LLVLAAFNVVGHSGIIGKDLEIERGLKWHSWSIIGYILMRDYYVCCTGANKPRTAVIKVLRIGIWTI